MKEASRIQAIIEVLEDVFKDTYPADLLLDKYFKARRYIGAKDRRFIGDAVWKIIRNRMHYQEMVAQHFCPRLVVALAFYHERFDKSICHRVGFRLVRVCYEAIKLLDGCRLGIHSHRRHH